MKFSCSSHDDELSKFYSSFSFKRKFLKEKILGDELTTICNEQLSILYRTGNKIKLATLLFRLNHLTSYKSHSPYYKIFLKCLCGYNKKDEDIFIEISELIKSCIPRLYGSYLENTDYIPLNIQGSKYKIFATIQIPDAEFEPYFNLDKPNAFDTYIETIWYFDINKKITLRIDYPLFEHLSELKNGKLSTYFDNEKNLSFNNFVRAISQYSKAKDEVKIIDCNGKHYTISNKYNKIKIY